MVVRTTCGDFFILDKRRNTLIPWYKTGYTCIKRGGEAPFVMSGKSANLLR
jgi:predicted transglutaminase-like cysteine proteinase